MTYKKIQNVISSLILITASAIAIWNSNKALAVYPPLPVGTYKYEIKDMMITNVYVSYYPVQYGVTTVSRASVAQFVDGQSSLCDVSPLQLKIVNSRISSELTMVNFTWTAAPKLPNLLLQGHLTVNYSEKLPTGATRSGSIKNVYYTITGNTTTPKIATLVFNFIIPASAGLPQTQYKFICRGPQIYP